MSIDEMKRRRELIHERAGLALELLGEMERMERFDVLMAEAITMVGGSRSSLIEKELLRDVLSRGIEAAMMARHAEVSELLAVAVKCKACGGHGTLPGEAAGLVCGQCQGRGWYDPANEPD